MKNLTICIGLALLGGLAVAQSSVDVTVRQAPYVVSTVSTRSENARAECKYCGKMVFYTRTYKWNVYSHVWEETTKDVPDVCRSCKSKDKAQAKLDAEERKLDRDIEYQKTRGRIDAKKRKLDRLRNQNR